MPPSSQPSSDDDDFDFGTGLEPSETLLHVVIGQFSENVGRLPTSTIMAPAYAWLKKQGLIYGHDFERGDPYINTRTMPGRMRCMFQFADQNMATMFKMKFG